MCHRLAPLPALLLATHMALAGEWTGQDLGTPGMAGDEHRQGNTWTVRGGGAGPFYATPPWAGRFLHRSAEGDFRFTARLHLTRCKGGRVGVMVRDSLDPRAWFRFIHVDEGRVRGLVRYPRGFINWGYHDTQLGYAETVWLRLERSGRCVVARWSRNGVDWNLVSPTQVDWTREAARLEVGVAVMRDEKDNGLAVGVVDELRLEPLKREYRTSWVGNTEGANPHWVQNHLAALTVAPDGTVYTASEWDEGSREMGIYRDGKVVGSLEGGFHDGKHHTAVACDSEQVVIAIERDGVVGLQRYAPDGRALDWEGGGRFRPLPGARRAGATALSGSTLAVADMDWHKPALAAQKLHLYTLAAGGPEHLQSWPVERIGRVAVNGRGEAWAIQQARREGFRVIEPARVVHLRSGSPEPVRQIGDAGNATAVAVAPDGKLWVADNGPAQRIRIFDVSRGRPRPAGHFGDQGGVYGGTPGAMGEHKLPPRVIGIGFDARGNVVIGADGWDWSGADIRAFAPRGKMLWQLVGLHGVVDMGGIDRVTRKDVFSDTEHFTLDWSKPDGPGWTYAGYTLDPFRFPEDARLLKGLGIGIYGRECTRVRRIRNRRFLIVSDMYTEHLAVYRFDDAHGEIAVPCARVMAKDGGAPNAPPGPWLWMDANGDGAYQAGEFDPLPDVRPGCGPGFDVDGAGDLWVVGTRILRLRFAGLDSRGAPRWDPTPRLAERPASFTTDGGHELKQVLSLPEREQFWLSGWGKGRTNPWNFFASAGSLLTCYDAPPMNADAVPVVSIPLPTDFLTGGQVTRSFDVAGDYVFTADQYDARVLVYDARTGDLVHTMVPGSEVGGRSGWVDVAYGVSAIRRDNGEYVLLVEDDGYCKLMLYRWDPSDIEAPAAPLPRVEHGVLKWNVDEAVGSWTVQRVDGAQPRAVAHNLRAVSFSDPGLLGGTGRYRVLAVNAGGASAPSKVVTIRAPTPGERLTLSAIGSNAKAAAEAAKAIDGDPGTFSYTEDPKAWIGVTLEDGVRPTRLRLKPRPGLGSWLRQGVLEACAGDPAKGAWTRLLTADREMGDGWHEFAIADERPWRHLRWRGPAGKHNTIAEMQVLGVNR